MRKIQGNLFVTIVMGDSADSMVSKEKSAVRKLREAVFSEDWKPCVKPVAHQGLFQKRPWCTMKMAGSIALRR